MARTRRRRWWAAAVTVLVGSGGVWAAWHYVHGASLNRAAEAKLAGIRQQFQQLSPRAASTLSVEQRRQAMHDLRQQVEQLPPEQRRQLWEQQRETMRKDLEKRVHDFFALPSEQRTAALDKAIQEMEQRRQAWQQGRGQAGGPPLGRSPRPLDDVSRIQRRVNRLNATTPETRAYFQLVQQRRRALGLPDFGRPR